MSLAGIGLLWGTFLFGQLAYGRIWHMFVYRAGLRKFGALDELPVGAHHVVLPFYGILQRYESNTTILS